MELNSASACFLIDFPLTQQIHYRRLELCQLPSVVSVKPSHNIEPWIELFTGAESHGDKGT